MAGFLKIRYNANGFLKNRIINADSIDMIEPFSGPAGRYVEESRSRIFMKDGTRYDMSVSVDEIQNLLRDAGALVAEVHSKGPERQTKVAAVPASVASVATSPQTPAPSVSLYKRPQAQKPVGSPEALRKSADGTSIMRKPQDTSGLKQSENGRSQSEVARG